VAKLLSSKRRAKISYSRLNRMTATGRIAAGEHVVVMMT
jgi:hypothetical protein